MLEERRAHRRERARLGQTKSGQSLAEIGQGDGALGTGGRSHGDEPTTATASQAIPVRDAVHASGPSRAISAGTGTEASS
ncbi:MAG: hypothetical protein ABSC94_33930 [Polyangiaceae bacterium]